MSRSKPIISIRLLGSIVAVGLIVTTVIATAVVNERKSTQSLTEEVHARLQMMSRSLALMSADLLLEDYPELLLLPFIKDLQLARPELTFVIVTDDEGVIRGHVDIEQVGQVFELPSDMRVVEHAPGSISFDRLMQNAELIASIAPVEVSGREQAGRTIVAMERDYLTAKIATARRSQLLVVLVLLVIGVLVALATVTLLLRPLKPLRAALERIGRGDLDTVVEIRDRTELGLLAETVNSMASELKSAQHQMVEKERLNHEMSLAQQIQESLRPPEHTVVDGFVIHGMQKAAAEVGGDYMDVLRFPSGKIGLVVADVSGKGLAGCLATAMLAALLRAFRTLNQSPQDLLRVLDENLQESVPLGTFVTMFYGLLDPRTGEMQLVSAGHNPTLIYRAQSGSIEWLHPKGRPLAAVRKKSRKITFESMSVRLGPRDLLLQYTDGITEAWRNGQHVEQFGFDRIEDVVRAHAGRGAAAVAETLFESVERWTGDHPRSDDEAVLVVSREATLQQANPAIATAAAIRSTDVATSGAPHDDSLSATALEGVLAAMADARTTEVHFSVKTRMPALQSLRVWMGGLPLIERLQPEIQSLAHNALYEICANIIEHGHRTAAEGRIEVFWLQPQGSASGAGAAVGEPELADRIRACWFVINDRGDRFDPRVEPTRVRRQDVLDRGGRGLGRQLVARVMSQVLYSSDTRYGNLTLMRFDPDRCRSLVEVYHGRNS